MRTRGRGSYLIFGLGVVLFIWALLTWAARGATLNFVDLLAETLVSTTPLVYGALSGVMCERSGVVNIAIEGQFLAGAFLGAMIGSATGNLWLGVVAGGVAGAIFGGLLAFLALRYGADQIIVGVVIVAFCTGLTNFLTETVLTPYQTTLNSPSTFPPSGSRCWTRSPSSGRSSSTRTSSFTARRPARHHPGGAVQYPLGLAGTGRGRAPEGRRNGRHPRASVRYRNVILGGVIAGIGGASFTIGSIGEFSADMTAGLGYVALAAMIFGRWRPFGALGAALLFGFAVSLQSFLAVLNVGIPSPFLSMAPYVITIAVVSGLVGRVARRRPTASRTAGSRSAAGGDRRPAPLSLAVHYSLVLGRVLLGLVAKRAAPVENRPDWALKGDLGPISVVQQQLRDPSRAIGPNSAGWGTRLLSPFMFLPNLVAER